MIAVSSAGTSRWSDEMVKNPINPSYNPNTIMGFTDVMTLYQRLINSVTTVIDMIAYQ